MKINKRTPTFIRYSRVQPIGSADFNVWQNYFKNFVDLISTRMIVNSFHDHEYANSNQI